MRTHFIHLKSNKIVATMYKDDPVFPQPQDKSEKIWRYMDFTKFLSVLEARSLYFRRADKFEDPFEGSYPRINVEARQNVPQYVPAEHKGKFMEVMDKIGDANRHWPRYTAINCWHLNNHESAAMWPLYSKSSEGIAIQTTYRKFLESFSSVEEDVFVGKVKYIDYDKEWIDTDNLLAPILTPFTHKRKSFEHEREVRAVVTRWPVDNGIGMDFNKETINHGLSIPVDLNLLIESIYIAPKAQAWFADLVSAVVKRYGYHYDVIHSNLDEQPLY